MIDASDMSFQGRSQLTVVALVPGFYDRFVFPAEQRLVDAIRGMGCRVRPHIYGYTAIHSMPTIQFPWTTLARRWVPTR
jgi:hypothetical protein